MEKLPTVELIVCPVIDWNRFVSGIKEITNESPTRGLDAENRRVGDYLSFIAALGHFEQTYIPQDAYRIKHLLDQLSFTFQISLSQEAYYEIIQKLDLNFVSNGPLRNRVALLSGTLFQWKIACITQFPDNFEARLIFNMVYLTFRKIGLGPIFAEYRRRELKDQTFVLEL